MKYEITKEQILETIRTGTDVTERYFKEIIPEAFKKELEIGKWYKYKLALFYVTNKRSNNANYYNVFGFDVDGNWMTDNAATYFDENYIEATDEEVEAALKKEAKKRGFEKSVESKCLVSNRNAVLSSDPYFSGDRILARTKDLVSEFMILFKDGKWAEILSQEKTVVPMEKALKIIAKKMKVSPENIEIKN